MKNSLGAMILIVAASNYLVQFPINDWLTLGAFTYPISFLVTELTVRFHGTKRARQIVLVGFIVGVILSYFLSTPKIAIASGTAFLCAQLLDISIFNRLRNGVWWTAPFFASFSASVIDSVIFWNLAFFNEGLPLFTLAAGDTAVKILVDLAMLTPFRMAISRHQI